eukprot:6459435-Amphidinium_carterae.2
MMSTLLGIVRCNQQQGIFTDVLVLSTLVQKPTLQGQAFNIVLELLSAPTNDLQIANHPSQ